MIPWHVPAQYCVRQGATAYLEMWALLLAFAGAAVVTRKTSRALSGTYVAFAVLTGVLGVVTFYGCSMTAAGEQGMGTDLPSGTYTILRCLGYDVYSLANTWLLFAVSCTAAIALLVFGLIRWKKAARAYAFTGSALLTIAAFAFAFFLAFGFSWCSSSRLF